MAIQVLTAASPTPILVEIGGFVSPMPAPLLLTAVPVNAGGIDTLTLTGTLAKTNGTPMITPLVLTRIADSGGYPSWRSGIVTVYYSGAKWSIETTGYVYLAEVTSTAASPVGLTGWTVVAGSGQPTFPPNPAIPAATQLGQSAIVTHSDGTKTEWVCVATDPGGIWQPRTPGIIWDEGDLQYRRQFYEEGSLLSSGLTP